MVAIPQPKPVRRPMTVPVPPPANRGAGIMTLPTPRPTPVERAMANRLSVREQFQNRRPMDEVLAEGRDVLEGIGVGSIAGLLGLPADLTALVVRDAPQIAAKLVLGQPLEVEERTFIDKLAGDFQRAAGAEAVMRGMGFGERIDAPSDSDDALSRAGVNPFRQGAFVGEFLADPLLFLKAGKLAKGLTGAGGSRSTDALVDAAAGDAAARAGPDFGVPPADEAAEAAGPPEAQPQAQPQADAAPEAQPEVGMLPDDVSIESVLTLDTQKALPSISAPPDDLPAVSQADKTPGGEAMHGSRVDYSPTRTILGALPENTEFTGDQLLRLFDINNEALGNRPFRESIQRDLAGTRFDEWIRLNVPAGRTMSRDQLIEAFDNVAPELRMTSLREPDLESSPIFYGPDGQGGTVEGFNRRNDGSPMFVGSREESFESYQETIPTNFVVPNTDPNRGGGVGVERVHFYLNNANDTAVRLSRRNEDRDAAEAQGIAAISGDFGVPAEMRFAHGSDHQMGQTSTPGVPGLLAHGRAVIIEDAAGRKILVLQELQSNQALNAFRGPTRRTTPEFNGKVEGDFIYSRPVSSQGVVYTQEGLEKIQRGELPTNNDIVERDKFVPLVREDNPASPDFGRPVPARYVQKQALDPGGNPAFEANGDPIMDVVYADNREPVFELDSAQLTPTIRAQMEIISNMPENELTNILSVTKLQSLQEGLNRARTSVQQQQLNADAGRPVYTPPPLPTLDDIAAGAATPEAGELAKFMADTLVNSEKVSIEDYFRSKGLSARDYIVKAVEKSRESGESSRKAALHPFDTPYTAATNPSHRTPAFIQALESDGPEAIARFDELWSASEQSVLGLSDEAMERIDELSPPTVNQYGNYSFVDNIDTLRAIRDELTSVFEQQGLSPGDARDRAVNLSNEVVAPRLHRLSENKSPFEYIKERSTRPGDGFITTQKVFNKFVETHVFDDSNAQVFDYVAGNKLLALEAASKDPTLGDLSKVARLIKDMSYREGPSPDKLNYDNSFVPHIPFANMKSLEEFHAKAFLMEAHRMHEAGEIDGVFLPNYHDMKDVGGRPPLKTVKGTYEDAVRKAVSSLGLNADEVTSLQARNFETGNIEEVPIGNRTYATRFHGEKGPGRMIYFNAPGNDLSDRVEGMRPLVIKRAKGGPVDLRPKKLIHSGIGGMARQVM